MEAHEPMLHYKLKPSLTLSLKRHETSVTLENPGGRGGGTEAAEDYLALLSLAHSNVSHERHISGINTLILAVFPSFNCCYTSIHIFVSFQ